MATDTRCESVTASDETTIAALWRESWARLTAECPELEDRLATLPPAVLRLEASAARWSARVIRGEADTIEAEAKIVNWADAVLEALTEQDQRTSEQVCGHCGDHNVETTAPKLTGARTCAKCAGEATP